MADATWPHILTALLNREDLLTEQSAWAMSEIVGGNATDAQIAAFTVALRAKGETPEEVAGLAESIISAAIRVELDLDAVDVGRHRWRPGAHRQHLHDGRDRGGRRGHPGGQAWRPSGLLGMRTRPMC